MGQQEVTANELATLARRVVERGDLDEVLRQACNVMVDVMAGADEASISLVTNGDPATFGATGELAIAADQRQYEAGSGPCLDAARANQIVIVTDLAQDPRWSAAPEMVRCGARSSLSIPLPIQGESIGALNLYSRAPDVFADSIPIGSTFAAYTAVAVANAVSYSTAADAARNLQQAMEYRSVIEQAKGIIIANTGCDADSAFDLLVEQSQHENRKLRDVAADLVQQASRGGAKPSA